MVFLVLEGVDGCGKSTVAKLLVDWLEREKGRRVYLTAEPTKNRIGRFIREILSGSEEVDPATLALLFTADRLMHVRDEIKPALERGEVVVCERYIHSTIAYQAAQGVGWQWLYDINKYALKPDLVFYIDADPAAAAKRTKTQEIFENHSFLEKVRDNYLKFNDQVVKVGGEKPIPEIFEEIKEVLGDKIK